MKSVKYFIILSILFSVPRWNNAQDTGNLTDSLYYYLELAAKNNPTVLQRYNEYLAALQKVPQVGSLPDPEFTLGVFLKPMELVEGSQAADIRLMQMFPWFGTLRAAKDEMSLMARAKYESFRDAKQQVYFDVQSTWFDIYKLHQNLKISERNIQILKTIERLALVRFRTTTTGAGGASSSVMNSASTMQSQVPPTVSSGMQGMSSVNQEATYRQAPATSTMQGNQMGAFLGGYGLADLYRIQIEIADLQNNIALLKNEQNTATAKFNSYLNRPIQLRVSVADTLIADTLKVPVLAVTDSIMKKNPMLGMLEYEQQSLDAKKRMVTKMGYPMVGLGINYSLITKSEMSTSSMNGNDMIMPMISATIPIYRKKYRAMKSEVELLKTSTINNYNAIANNLQVEYYQALQLYQDAARRMRLFSDQYNLARNSLDIKLAGFSAGNYDLTDILLIHQQVLDFELRQIEAVSDYNTSIAWLNKLMANSHF
ncbi:MAG: TolC family protein [Bacteroidota bacterium]|nr:TolC family protein [Bacteroidota bacterium]